MATPKLTDTERQIMTTCRDLEAEIAARPQPGAWQRWERDELDHLKRYGPLYRPSEWFGGGRPIPEKYRVRYLRAINKLIAAGLLTGATTEGNRLAHLRLTEAGAQAIAPRPKRAKSPPASTGGT